MDHWEGTTSAKAIANGATIYIDRGGEPVLPAKGTTFTIEYADGRPEHATILATSAEAIMLTIRDAQWLIAPASEPRREGNGRILQGWLVVNGPANSS